MPLTHCGASRVQIRSSKQDQIHNSIVSTLLALMDGLTSRGQVVVIGATNRCFTFSCVSVSQACAGACIKHVQLFMYSCFDDVKCTHLRRHEAS